MATLFVENLTVVDFSYLHAKRGMVGESWIVDLELSGDLDAQAQRRIGLPWSANLVDRVTATMGGAVAAAVSTLCWLAKALASVLQRTRIACVALVLPTRLSYLMYGHRHPPIVPVRSACVNRSKRRNGRHEGHRGGPRAR